MPNPSSPEFSVCRLTAPGRSAVATLLIDGPGSRQAIERYFQPRVQARWKAHAAGTTCYGTWNDGEGYNEDLVIGLIDEASYEIHCHGGVMPSSTIVRHLKSVGGRETTSWDFACRQGPNIVAAEASWLLAQVDTARPSEHLLGQLDGPLEQELMAISKLMMRQDFSAATDSVDRLLETWKIGRWLSRMPRVVLLGEPNVGKSSLINCLLGYDRSLVFDRPGTTRDVVTAVTVLEGWPFELRDLAGIRQDSDDPLELQGIRKAIETLESIDLIIEVADAQSPSWIELDQLPPELPRIRVVNKCDLVSDIGPDDPAAILTSANTGQGIESLMSTIRETLIPDRSVQAAMLFTNRQLVAARALREACAAQRIEAAEVCIKTLLEGTGELPPEPIYGTAEGSLVDSPR